MVLESDAWKFDPEIQKLPTLDILLSFEDYSRVREREFEEQARRAQVEKNRKERKTREGFKVSVIISSRPRLSLTDAFLGSPARTRRQG